jgi:large repetitive protein
VLTLTPNNGSFSAPVTANGSGFTPLAAVTVAWNSTVSLCSADSNATGAFSCSFHVPMAPAGYDVLNATDGTNQGSSAFEVVPSAALNVGSVVVGQPLTANGYGFGPSEELNVTWDHGSTVCASTPTNTNGAASCTFLVPASPGGENNVTFTQGPLVANQSLTVATLFSVSPPSGVAGTVVTLTGSGFAASVAYLACLETTLASCATGTSFTTGTNGSVPSGTTLTVPNTPSGSYYLVTSVGGTVVASANFVVTTATVATVPTTGPVGTLVDLSGSGFSGGGTYSYCFQASIAACPPTTVTGFIATGSGTIPSGGATLTVPPGPSGGYYVDVSSSTGLSGAAEFTLVANLSVNRTTANVSTSVLAEGTGFPGSTSYTLLWNSTVSLCSGSTNSTGGFDCTFEVPPSPAGPRTIVASAGSDSAGAELSVGPSVALSSTSGAVGTRIGVIATGFSAQVVVSVDWNGTPVCSGSTDTLGRLSCVFIVPAVPDGTYPVNVSEPGTTLLLRFAVTASLESTQLEGAVGSEDTLTGRGFAASSAYSVVWNSTTDLCSGVTSSLGGWNCTFAVPLFPQGSYPVSASVASNTTSVEFTIVPSATFSPASGSPGLPETITGTGFAFGKPYSVRWNASVAICSGTVGATGQFFCNFTVPSTVAGVYSPIVTNGGGIVGASFTVRPMFSVSVASAPVGSFVGILGEGFDARASYSLLWSGARSLCEGTTNTSGGLSCTFAVPPAAQGPYPLQLSEGTYALESSLEVQPWLAVSPDSAMPGTLVTATGTGFSAGAPYAITWTATGTLCSGTTDSNGSFQCTFLVPSVAPGVYTISAAQGANAPTVTLFVAALPVSPATPSSDAFEVWLAVLAVVVAGVAGAVLYLYQRRKRAAGTPRSLTGPPPVAGSPERNDVPTATEPFLVPPVQVERSSDAGADALFLRLIPRYREVLQETSPSRQDSPADPKKKVEK